MTVIGSSKEIKVYILVGGKGTRLASHSNGIPKPLIDIKQKPFILYLLDKIGASLKPVLVCSSINEKYFQEFLNYNNLYHVEVICEGNPDGTGGWLKKFDDEGILPDEFYVMNGDTFFSKPLNLDVNESTIFVSEEVIEGDEGYIEGNDNVVTRMIEKNKDAIGETKMVNLGIYKFYKKDLNLTDKTPVSIEYDILPNMNLKYKVLETEKFDIGTIERLRKFEEWCV